MPGGAQEWKACSIKLNLGDIGCTSFLSFPTKRRSFINQNFGERILFCKLEFFSFFENCEGKRFRTSSYTQHNNTVAKCFKLRQWMTN